MTDNPPVGRVIGMTANMLRRYMDKKLSDVPFGWTEISCLCYIINHVKENPETHIFQKDIEKSFNLRSPTASEIIKNLEQKGLIVRESIKGDGRKKKLIPTEKGFICDSQIKSRLEEVNQKISEGISEDEMKIYRQVTDKIIENLRMEEING